MKLMKIEATNFRSFEHFKLDLNATGIYAVTGPNGAGKSSIFSAVEWALFGGKRGPGTPVRRHGCDEECRVELEFEVGGRVFQVVRVDGSDASLTDVATGNEFARGLTDTSHEVAVQLGLTQNMFGGTFYARQKEVQALSSSKNLSDRRDQLERLLGIEHLRVAADLAAHDARVQKGIVDGLCEDAPDEAALRAEVERCEQEAQRATPAIAALEAKVTKSQQAEQGALDRINALTKQVSEHSARKVAATEAEAQLKHEQTVLANLRQQLATARTAETELVDLAPVAARSDEITALEREMEQHRRNHELVEGLRAKERGALENLAKANDLLAFAGEPPAEESHPAKVLSNSQQKLNDLGEQLRAAAAARGQADDAARIINERLARATARSEAERELATLTSSEAEVARSRERWQQLRDQRADVQAQLNHDAKHRDALRDAGDTDTAVCPTCQRPLEGTLADLLDGFEAAIAQHQSEVSRLTEEMDRVAAVGAQHRADAERAQELRAKVLAIGDAGDPVALAAELDSKAVAARTAAELEQELDRAYRELADTIPALRSAAELAAELDRQRADALEQKRLAEQAALGFAEQLSAIGANGYNAAAHAQLKVDLEASQSAVRRSAALRESADALPLLEGRVAQQEPLVEELQRTAMTLREQAAEIEPAANAQEVAEAEHRRIADEHAAARRALESAKQQVSMESAAVTAARAKLEDGRKLLRRIELERKEHAIQAAVAQALSDYREHASQRNRPAFEEEASNLLKRVTGGEYPVIRLTDSYLLEIADGGRFHPLKRFSGGEQDLAALCLRLALSRTLARQRGAEHGFVILDEVFGSQDSDRRGLLMQQLGELAEAEFQQIFVISHTDDVSEHCHLHIKVRRNEEGISVASGPS